MTEWAKEINLQHVSIFLLVLILFVIFAVMYKLWCKKAELFFTFAIEIVSNGTYHYVKLCTLNGSMDDYVVVASDFINNITIEGCLKPTLKYKWKNVMCIDQVTQVKTEISKNITVTWWEKQKIMEMFQQDFKINPVFEKNGNIRRVMIKHVE